MKVTYQEASGGEGGERGGDQRARRASDGGQGQRRGRAPSRRDRGGARAGPR